MTTPEDTKVVYIVRPSIKGTILITQLLPLGKYSINNELTVELINFIQRDNNTFLFETNKDYKTTTDMVGSCLQNTKIMQNLKEDFIIVEEGTSYLLPIYKVEDNKGIVPTEEFLNLVFVRGSKLLEEEVEKREGTLHEHLLATMIHDLSYKQSLVPSDESAQAIIKLKEALGWLRERQINRTKQGTLGTYKK
jgi:hypothetical protein